MTLSTLTVEVDSRDVTATAYLFDLLKTAGGPGEHVTMDRKRTRYVLKVSSHTPGFFRVLEAVREGPLP